jgi:hypothetical protein
VSVEASSQLDPALVARPPQRDPLRFSPLFIVAPARSHTSVISTMIGLHPQLSGFPELTIFRRNTVHDLITDPPGWKGVSTRRRLAGLLRTLAQLHDGEQTVASVAAAMQWLEQRRQWGVADVFDYLLGHVAPRTGVEKSPDNSARADFLARLRRSYPRARFIHLTRHPVTTVESMWEVYHDKGLWNIPPELLHQFCLGAWYFHHRRLLRLAEELPPEQILRVRSEDVLADPPGQLAAIARWIGVDDSPAAIDAMCHPERSVFAVPGPAGAEGGNDTKFLRNPGLRPPRWPDEVGVPRQWVVDPWFHVEVLRLAGFLGYDRQPEPAGGTAGRLGQPPAAGAGGADGG